MTKTETPSIAGGDWSDALAGYNGTVSEGMSTPPLLYGSTLHRESIQQVIDRSISNLADSLRALEQTVEGLGLEWDRAAMLRAVQECIVASIDHPCRIRGTSTDR